MLGECLKVRHFKGKVSQVRADDDRAAGGVGADFDEFFALGSFEEDELGTAGGFVPAHFFKTEDILVKADGLFEIGDAITGVEEFGDHGG